jgi:hypothetical protein
MPAGFGVPMPSDDPSLRPDEEPLGEDLFTELVEERINSADDPLQEDGPA